MDRMQSILSVLPLLLCQVSLTLLVNVVSGQTSAKVSSIVRTTDNDQVPNAVDTYASYQFYPRLCSNAATSAASTYATTNCAANGAPRA